MPRWRLYPLLLLSGTAAASAQEAPLTKEDAARAVANSCPFNRSVRNEDAWIAGSRNRFVVNDRLTTRNHEIEINKAIADQETCLGRTQTQVLQSGTISQATRTALLGAIADRQKQAPAGIRAMYAAAGYRPSSAPPGPRYGFCTIHDDYGAEFGYLDHYYTSRVFMDRDPENEVPDIKHPSGGVAASPKTAEGKRVLDAMSGWAAARYKPATERVEAFCTFFVSAQEAADSLPKGENGRGNFYFDTGLP